MRELNLRFLSCMKGSTNIVMSSSCSAQFKFFFNLAEFIFELHSMLFENVVFSFFLLVGICWVLFVSWYWLVDIQWLVFAQFFSCWSILSPSPSPCTWSSPPPQACQCICKADLASCTSTPEEGPEWKVENLPVLSRCPVNCLILALTATSFFSSCDWIVVARCFS